MVVGTFMEVEPDIKKNPIDVVQDLSKRTTPQGPDLIIE